MARQKKALNLCAVAWCAAFATRGSHCPVHATYPTLRPEYLGADEVFAAAMARCKVCEASGKCHDCDGSGRHTDYCDKCRSYEFHDCGACRGSGKCATCDGEGRVTFTKNTAEAHR